MRDHTAATAFRHSLAASARKIRSVDRIGASRAAREMALIVGAALLPSHISPVTLLACINDSAIETKGRPAA